MATEHPESPDLDGVNIIRCSHFLRGQDDPQKCGWTGTVAKYQAHLDQFHGGKEYQPLPVGLPTG